MSKKRICIKQRCQKIAVERVRGLCKQHLKILSDKYKKKMKTKAELTREERLSATNYAKKLLGILQRVDEGYITIQDEEFSKIMFLLWQELNEMAAGRWDARICKQNLKILLEKGATELVKIINEKIGARE